MTCCPICNPEDESVFLCHACETDEGVLCDGCECCQECCNCSPSDCDCSACEERRASHDT